jgi:cation diffusion facilitator CzcD-associated flavoprotein CzcO
MSGVPVSRLGRGDAHEAVDAIVIGAGFGGLRMLHELRGLELSVKAIEAGSDVGGTWYWNRYPGARTDSEAWVYCYSFDENLLAEWDWSERFPKQPEMLRYLQHVADHFDLRRDIQFDTRVAYAHYDEDANRWVVATESGGRFTCTYLICATGLLSAPYEPPFPGLASFEGQSYVTARWPKEPVDLTGKRVAVVGTGATGVQVITVVAQIASQLTVFQRTPNYVLPARDHAIDEEQRQAIKASYGAIWQQVRQQVFAFAMKPAGRVAADVTPEQHRQILDAGWESGGFRYIFETFDDILVDAESNAAASDYVREKIRAIVKNSATAELLCPRNHPLVGKRPPLGHFYYEAFNRDSVHLVDVSENPIVEITASGLRTETDEYEFDVIIFATGFDAAIGALRSMDVRGRNGVTINAKWAKGPRTHLGIMVDGFPNMFMISGPQSPFANIPPIIENTVRWIGQALADMRDDGHGHMEATPEAVAAWCTHLTELVNATVVSDGEAAHSWFVGANIPDKPHVAQLYFGGAPAYFAACQSELERGYEGFAFAGRQ